MSKILMHSYIHSFIQISRRMSVCKFVRQTQTFSISLDVIPKLVWDAVQNAKQFQPMDGLLHMYPGLGYLSVFFLLPPV